MQRTSNSIASLAAALAKAQIELANPEKSLVGTIEPAAGEGSAAPVPLCLALKRSRDRAQDIRPA